MEQWKEYRLGEVLTIKYGKDHKKLKEGNIPVYGSGGVMRYVNKAISHGPSLLIPRKGSLNNIIYSPSAFWTVDTMFWTQINSDIANPLFLYYSICKKDFAALNVGTAVPSLTVPVIEDIKISLPDLDIQSKICAILKSLDDKIDLNRKINSNLEEQAKALFKSWFIDFEPFKDGKFVDSELGMIPEGWEVLSLDEIADYLNGLAMQKFRPTAGEDHLPVLKIKELGQGYCDESCDICSSNVPSQYIVNDSDIIFSWSGTLKVDIWCGGRCGLNQHLFKVTSKEYPKWFYLMWTLEHLNRFIHIAKDKAVTMGHIKREELHKAKVVVPSTPIFNKANMIFAPILNEMINTRTSNRKLIAVRDTLLPKLMSGEIKV